MILRTLFLCLSVLFMFQSGLVADQAKPRKTGMNDSRVERSDSRPDLAVKFDDAAQLKIVSRKSAFHIGEMVTLDIALLNTSSQPLFFPKLVEPTINVMNSGGQKLMVQKYGVVERALVPGLFVRLSPGEIIVESFQLLVGCDKRAFAQFASDGDDRTLFNQGLFLTWGDACLPSPQTATFTLSVELRNKYVRLPSRTEKVRSAVGTINSNSLEMTILK